MAFTTIPSAGAKLRASVLSALITEVRPISAVKTVDTSRASDATRTADPDLTISLPANSTWAFTFTLILTSAANAAGDFTGEIQFPASAVVMDGVHGLVDTLASGRSADLLAHGFTRDSSSPTPQFDIGCSTLATAVMIQGRIELGATAGSLLLAWGQLASNGNATVLQDGSTLHAVRLA